MHGLSPWFDVTFLTTFRFTLDHAQGNPLWLLSSSWKYFDVAAETVPLDLRHRSMAGMFNMSHTHSLHTREDEHTATINRRRVRLISAVTLLFSNRLRAPQGWKH